MPPRKKSPATPTPAAEVDPLADLRQEWGGGGDAMEAPVPQSAVQVEGILTDTLEVSVPLVTEEQREQMTAAIIAAWHADPISHGFLHRGNRCGCRYIIARALDAVAPAAPDTEEEADPDGD